MGYSDPLIGAAFLPHLRSAEREAAIADKEAAYRDMVGALAPIAGLQRTGADAAHSIAFEDSLSGLRAAVGAGLTVVGMTTTLEEATLKRAGATIAVADFTDPRIVELI